MLEDLTIDVYVEPKVVGSSNVIEAYNFIINITDGDVVTIITKQTSYFESYSPDEAFSSGENSVEPEVSSKFLEIINNKKIVLLNISYEGRSYNEYVTAFDVGDRSCYTRNFLFRVIDDTNIHVAKF